MDDLISREDVIKAIENEWDGCLGEYNFAQIIRDTCEAIDRVPSAQPEIKTDGDMISRKQTIDALMQEFKRIPTNSIRAKIVVENLPSAQPEYEPVTAEDFAKTMSENTFYSFMAWYGEALELMERQGFVICKKTM